MNFNTFLVVDSMALVIQLSSVRVQLLQTINAPTLISTRPWHTIVITLPSASNPSTQLDW